MLTRTLAAAGGQNSIIADRRRKKSGLGTKLTEIHKIGNKDVSFFSWNDDPKTILNAAVKK